MASNGIFCVINISAGTVLPISCSVGNVQYYKNTSVQCDQHLAFLTKILACWTPTWLLGFIT